MAEDNLESRGQLLRVKDVGELGKSVSARGIVRSANETKLVEFHCSLKV